MSVYVMAFIKLQKPSWTPLGQEVVDLVHEHGGRYLVRDTAPRQIEGSGEPPDEAVLVEFPSVEKAEAYYNDPRYEPYRETRKAATDTTLVLVEGINVLRSAHPATDLQRREGLKPVYAMVLIKRKSPSWTPLGQEVSNLVHEHGGRYLVRNSELRQIEGLGEPPDEAVIVEWPTIEKTEAHYNHPHYEPYREARKTATDTTLILAQGI